jgi:hypothetical protein
MTEGKICTKCKEYKSFNNYYKESKAPDGLKAKYKQCLYFVKKIHREKNKEKYKTSYQEFIFRNPNYQKIYYLEKRGNQNSPP